MPNTNIFNVISSILVAGIFLFFNKLSKKYYFQYYYSYHTLSDKKIWDAFLMQFQSILPTKKQGITIKLTSGRSHFAIQAYFPVLKLWRRSFYYWLFCTYLPACLPACLSIHLSSSLYIYISIYLSMSIFISLSVCLSVCRPVWLTVCLSVCLSVCLLCLSMYLSIMFMQVSIESNSLLYYRLWWSFDWNQLLICLSRSNSTCKCSFNFRLGFGSLLYYQHSNLCMSS